MVITQGTWGNLFGPLSNIDLGITEALGFGGYNPNQAPVIGQESDPSLIGRTVTQNNDGTYSLAPIQSTNPTYNIGTSGTYNTSGSNQVLTSTGGTTTQTNTAPNFNTVSNEEIDAVYNPLMSNLDSSYNALVASQPSYQNQVNQQAQLSNQKIADQKTTAQTTFGNQETQLNKQKESAISQARQLYNELSQRGISRFGGTGSAGKAYSEILGRSTAQSMGNAQQQLGEGIQTINQARTALDRDVATALQEIELNRTAGLEEIRRKFDADVREIDSNRALLLSQKQAQKLDALKESRQLMYAWEEQQKAYEQQISLYKISQGTTLDSQLSQLMKANIPQENIDVQGNVIARANDPTIQSFNAKAYDSISNPQMKGIWTKEEEDKYKSLNPFN